MTVVRSGRHHAKLISASSDGEMRDAFKGVTHQCLPQDLEDFVNLADDVRLIPFFLMARVATAGM